VIEPEQRSGSHRPAQLGHRHTFVRSLAASEEEIHETVHMAFLFGGLPGLVTGANAYPRKG
jgi:hypothetical protein